MVASKSSIATRNEIKVPKKPLATWMPLVARMSVPICARFDPLGGIGAHSLTSHAKHYRGAAHSPRLAACGAGKSSGSACLMRDVLPGIAQNMVAAFHREPHLSGAPALNATQQRGEFE